MEVAAKWRALELPSWPWYTTTQAGNFANVLRFGQATHARAHRHPSPRRLASLRAAASSSASPNMGAA